MKVAYVLEPPKFDISMLYQRYDVKMLFEQSMQAREYRLAGPEALYKWVYRWAVREFNPKSDLFVLTGNQTMLVVCIAAIMRAHPGVDISLLRYDTNSEDYTKFEIGGMGDERPSATSLLPNEELAS